MASSYEQDNKWVKGFTVHDLCVTLHFHHIKWDLFNFNNAAG